MMYPFITLNDNTEIVHSEMKPDGKVKVYIETPDNFGGFHSYHYSDEEIYKFDEIIHSMEHLIMKKWNSILYLNSFTPPRHICAGVILFYSTLKIFAQIIDKYFYMCYKKGKECYERSFAVPNIFRLKQLNHFEQIAITKHAYERLK